MAQVQKRDCHTAGQVAVREKADAALAGVPDSGLLNMPKEEWPEVFHGVVDAIADDVRRLDQGEAQTILLGIGRALGGRRWDGLSVMDGVWFTDCLAIEIFGVGWAQLPT